MINKIKVYIASPYSVGDQSQNVRRQMDCFNELRNKGLIPFIPLLTHFQHMVHPQSYESWMTWDFVWIEACDCLLRLDGESLGADREVEHAKLNNIPVFYSMVQLLAHYKIYQDDYY